MHLTHTRHDDHSNVGGLVLGRVASVLDNAWLLSMGSTEFLIRPRESVRLHAKTGIHEEIFSHVATHEAHQPVCVAMRQGPVGDFSRALPFPACTAVGRTLTAAHHVRALGSIARLARNRTVLVLGDSTMRNTYDAWNCMATVHGVPLRVRLAPGRLRQQDLAFELLEGPHAPPGALARCKPAYRTRCVHTGRNGTQELACCDLVRLLTP